MPRTSQHAALLFLGFALSIGSVAACSGPPIAEPERALRRARQLQQRAQSAAEQAVAGLAPYTLRARFNPCACAHGPSIEVYFEGCWHRVYLTGAEELLTALNQRAQRSAFVWVKGTPLDATQSEAGGQRFTVFQIDSLL
ncbi:MAG: hypothetical protein RBU37_11360 [Myxococcota bacterium]|nr:hypothetical protein [Myxococcota bacterium]